MDFKLKQLAAARAVGIPRKRPKTASPSRWVADCHLKKVENEQGPNNELSLSRSGSIADASNNSNGNNDDTSSSSNGHSISVSKEHNTPTLPSSSSIRSDANSATTTDSGFFSNSSRFEPYGASETVSSSGLTSISSGEHSRPMTSYPWYKQSRYHHHPYKNGQLGHRPPIQSGESSESRSTSDHSQFTGSSASNSFSPSSPYETLPASTPVNNRLRFKDPSKTEPIDMIEPSMVGAMPRSTSGLYQKKSTVRPESVPSSSPRLPPLRSSAATVAKWDADGSSGSPAG